MADKLAHTNTIQNLYLLEAWQTYAVIQENYFQNSLITEQYTCVVRVSMMELLLSL